MIKRLLTIISLSYIFAGSFAAANNHQILEKITLLVPGHAHSMLNQFARDIGETLQSSGFIKSAAYQNVPYQTDQEIASALKQSKETNSLLVVSHHSMKNFLLTSPESLRPIASIIGDYGAIVVNGDSEIYELSSIVESYRFNSRNITFGGGTDAGDIDHLIAALVMKNSGNPIHDLQYVAFETGEEALNKLLSYELLILSTRLSVVYQAARQGQVNIICITARTRLEAFPDTPTCSETGAKEAYFIDWYGVLANSNITARQKTQYTELIRRLISAPQWRQRQADHNWIDFIQYDQDFAVLIKTQSKRLNEITKELQQ